MEESKFKSKDGLARIRILLEAALAQSVEAGDASLRAICRERLDQINTVAILRPSEGGR